MKNIDTDDNYSHKKLFLFKRHKIARVIQNITTNTR